MNIKKIFKPIKKNVSMNILIVGNGFDLAHKLPTTYKDFFNILSINEKILTSNTNEIMPQEKYSTICDAIIKFKKDCETHSIDYDDISIDDISNSEETLNFYKKLRDNKMVGCIMKLNS